VIVPCTRRLKAYRGIEGGIAFSSRDGYYDRPLELACGQCMDCRLRRARDWALRMMHESQSYDANCFITLTYDDGHLPEDHGLRLRDWQLFAKRLRKSVGRFRFYHVGEYGERTLRPHYHALLFGVDFSADRKLFKVDGAYHLYTSEELQKVWDKGHCLIGELSFDSCCYVARYVTKKLKAPKIRSLYTAKCAHEAEKVFQRMDPETGEVWSVAPEYATMSRGGNASDGVQLGGIGKRYFEKFEKEIYVSDSVVDRGREYRPPRFYDRLLEVRDVDRYRRIARGRRERAIRASGGDPESRDRAREVVLLAQQGLRRGELDS